MNRSLFALALVLFTLPAAADFCDLDLRYENGQVRWKAITGATRYTVLELYGDVKAPVYSSTKNTFVDVKQRASGPVEVRYIVTAEIETGVRLQATASADACTGSIDLTLTPDAAFRKLTRRSVVPVVGSTGGAFGGRFRTSLELRGNGAQTGRIVFHPAGRQASDDDPSLPYSFLDSRVLRFEDIVAAMGQSGIGSLDIVPDEASVDTVPVAEARLYNDTTLGTFGTFTWAVLPSSYLRPGGMQVRIPDERFRVNIGIRTLEPTSYEVLIYRANGQLDGRKTGTYPSGWTEMKSASDFVGRALEPGQLLRMSFSGASIPFYTITENATNDPTLVLAPTADPPRSLAEFAD